jgi:Ca-activated chloride channel family protein
LKVIIKGVILVCILLPVSVACGGESPYRDLALSPSKIPDSIYFLIDTSGSMSDSVSAVGGTRSTKMNIATRALSDISVQLSGRSTIGLRSYPDPNGGLCNSGVLRSQLSESNESALNNAISRLTPSGDTPTAEALRAAAADISRSGKPATVVLLSDGTSNCADPCSAAIELSRSTDWKVITIGFDLGASGSDELRCIADATGGRYLNASDGAALEELFRDARRIFSVTG